MIENIKNILLLYFNNNNIIFNPFLSKKKFENSKLSNILLLNNIFYQNNFYLNMLKYMKVLKKINNNLTSYNIYNEIKKIESEYTKYFIEIFFLTVDLLLDKKTRNFLFGDYFINNYHLKKFFVYMILEERKNIISIQNLKFFYKNPILNDNFNNHFLKKFDIKTSILTTEKIYEILTINDNNLFKEFIINNKNEDKTLGNLSYSKYSHIINDIFKLETKKKINIKRIKKIILFEIEIILSLLQLKHKLKEYNYIIKYKNDIINKSIDYLYNKN